MIKLTQIKDKVTLADLIDLDFLQEFQDFFAKNMGISAITTDENGPITKASNFTGFCSKFVRGENASLEKCDSFHTECGKIAAKKGGTYIYTCPNGLTEFAVPILIKGKYIASIIGGQFFSEPPNEEDYKNVIKKSGVDEKAYLKEIKEIKVIPSPKIEEMAHLLALLTKNIENIMVKNFELIEKNKRANIYRHIEEIMRTSFDINLIKHEIVFQIGNYFKADRVVFAEYETAKDNYYVSPENEYRSSSDIKTFVGFDFSLFPIFYKGRDIIFNDLDKYLEENNLKNTDTEKLYKEMGYNSSMRIKITHGEIFYGNLVITFEEKNKINEDDINFIKVLAAKAGMSLYQAELYTKTIKQAEREKISRSMIEILRSTLDKNMIKHLFVKNIGKYFNADRVFFSDFDINTNTYLVVDDKSEYLSNPSEKSFINFDFSNPSVQGFIEPLLNKRELIIHNWNEYLENHPQSEEFIKLYKDARIQSAYKFPVLYEGKLLGFFCLDYTHNFVELPDEDISRVRSICTQAGIAIYQAELYMQAQEALQSKGELIAKVKNGIKEPVNNILKTSKALSEFELEHNKQLEYLDNIIDSCNKLMELTKDISDVADT